MDKQINIPLTWYEIDQIVMALRLTNKVLKGNMEDDLGRKMTEYSNKIKGELYDN